MSYGNFQEKARQYFNSQTGSGNRAYADAAAEYYSKLLEGEITPGGEVDASDVGVDPIEGMDQIEDVQEALESIAVTLSGMASTIQDLNTRVTDLENA